MITFRSYKYLIKPTAKQKEIIKETFKYCTYVYNRFLDENGFETYKHMMLKEVLYKYKAENEFLIRVDPSALMNVLFALQDLHKTKKDIQKKKNFAKSYTTSNLSGKQAIYFVDDEFINLPYLGNVNFVLSRKLPQDASILKATVSLDKTNCYYVSILYKIENKNSYKKIDTNNSIGLDYSQQTLYVDSNGNKCNVKHFYSEEENRLSKLDSALQKCEKGSNNYYKIKNKISKINKRIANQRNDFLHKESSRLANKYDLICVEDISMKEMASKFHLAKNTYENSYYKFLEYLKYKLEDRGKQLIIIDKYYPSSKKCNVCGSINKDLILNEREWVCPTCGTLLDRDVNAAINIKKRGIEKFMSVGYPDEAYNIGSISNSNSRRSAGF